MIKKDCIHILHYVSHRPVLRSRNRSGLPCPGSDCRRKLIQKYQQATCEQLWQERAQKGKKPESPMEQRALEMLKSDSQMRAAFINKIAAPIANKMFECGMIP